MDRLQKIKYKRLKSEERFLYDMLVHSKPHKSGKHLMYYTLNGDFLFEYDKMTNFIKVDYNNIWYVFETKYKLNFEEIQNLIEKMISITFNTKNITVWIHKSSQYKSPLKPIKFKKISVWQKILIMLFSIVGYYKINKLR